MQRVGVVWRAEELAVMAAPCAFFFVKVYAVAAPAASPCCQSQPEASCYSRRDGVARGVEVDYTSG